MTITPDSSVIAPGQRVTFTIAVSATYGPAGGFYMPTPTAGAFTALAGTKLWPDGGITHAAPGRASGNQVTFQVAWTAPAQPAAGGVNLTVFALSANGDNTNRNDGPTQTFASFAYGCAAGTKYYFDSDGDNYGSLASGWTLSCTPPPQYAKEPGDCNDSDSKIHPGAPEICDGKDNNCDGAVDEGLANIVLCEDKDGDGHGVMGATTHIGCTPNLQGFGVCDGDCKDTDPSVYPGAMELCNEQDDNCDGKVDENARPTCGVGWCKRYGEGCGANLCVPGPPRAEQCNSFDDDCDGVADNGSDIDLCGEASGCRGGRCVPIDTSSDGGSASSSSSTSGSGSGSPPGSGGSASEPTGSGGSSGRPSGDVGCTIGPRPPRSALGFACLLGVLACSTLRRTYSTRRRGGPRDGN